MDFTKIQLLTIIMITPFFLSFLPLLLIVVVCRDKQFLQQSAFKWLFFLIVSRPQYCRDCTKIFVLSLTVLLNSVHKLKRRSMETHIFQTKCSCWVIKLIITSSRSTIISSKVTKPLIQSLSFFFFLILILI